MQQTSNYQLSQWDAEDRIQREDFNSDNAKVDAALHETMQQLTESTTQLSTAVAKCGNCRIELQSYTGTGALSSSKYRTITFTETPLLVILIGSNSSLAFITRNSTISHVLDYNSDFPVTWTGTSLYWNPSVSDSYMMNVTGVSYTVILLLEPNT